MFIKKYMKNKFLKQLTLKDNKISNKSNKE